MGKSHSKGLEEENESFPSLIDSNVGGNIQQTRSFQYESIHDKPQDKNDSGSGPGENYQGGLNIATALVFVVGEMAGSGVLALPQAVESLGWFGLVLIVICGFLAAYTGAILGKCWIMLRELFPEYRGHTRNPYPAIGYRTYNKIGRYTVTFCIHATFIGAGVIFLLMSSEIIQQLLHTMKVQISFCYLMIVLWAVLTPFTWLGSPKDMWPVAVGALTTTAIACIIIVVKSVLTKDTIVVHHRQTEFKPALIGMGTLVYAFGNHPIFPTIQHDMKDPTKFTKAVFIGYFCVLCLYIPVAASGYLVFGSLLRDSILTTLFNLANGPALYVVQILIVLHLMFGYVILINPVSQEIEDGLGIRHTFNLKRVLCRTGITGTTLFLAETIPKFGNLLGLIGGSTMALLAFFFPVLFYNKLCKMSNRSIPLHQRIFHYEIMVIAVLIGISSTYAAIEAIVSPNSFVPPCYVNISAAEN